MFLPLLFFFPLLPLPRFLPLLPSLPLLPILHVYSSFSLNSTTIIITSANQRFVSSAKSLRYAEVRCEMRVAMTSPLLLRQNHLPFSQLCTFATYATVAIQAVGVTLQRPLYKATKATNHQFFLRGSFRPLPAFLATVLLYNIPLSSCPNSILHHPSKLRRRHIHR